MTAEEILEQARAHGATLSLDGEHICVQLSGRVLPAALRDAILEQREALVELLAFRADPRPDLAEDHTLWVRLLAMAERLPEDDLARALRALRCGGARLVASDGKVRLMPGDLSPAEYTAARAEQLAPHDHDLRQLLLHLADPSGCVSVERPEFLAVLQEVDAM